MQDSEDIPSNPCASGRATIGDLIEARLSRRGFLGGALAAGGALATGLPTGLRAAIEPQGPFSFSEIARNRLETHVVAPGHEAQTLLRWGDALFPDAPAWDPSSQSASRQQRQFGYNNDYIGFLPLTPNAGDDERGLLCVNHEYTLARLMFPGLGPARTPELSREQAAVELAAHGGSVVEVARRGRHWRVVLDSPFNRRITGMTPMRISGPAAGHPRLRTADDPSGTRVLGTLNNCAGGMTPWGTYLMAEENFNGNFAGELPADHPEAVPYARYGIPGGWYRWADHFPRFDVGRTPLEPNRFGWVVEVDPRQPDSTPVKRTALGRFKHEGAESVVAPDGRVVLYMGDDQRFDYVYKFVTARPFVPGDPAANRDLLDDGTLYVARFDADGSVTWLPLVHGQGPLVGDNGFHSQADVLIGTRQAADLLGATPMDRPEDVEPDPAGGRVWVMLTNNTERTAAQVDAANPRARNANGHIIEIREPDGDFAATRSRWEILVRCGDPGDPAVGASWNSATSPNGWFGSPDNCAVDPAGRLWVATDGNEKTGANDGVWAVTTEGAERGTGRAFFSAPIGAELCGPRFTPGGDTLFVAVQHPGDGDQTSFEHPATRWPDFREGIPPRPAVLAIRRKDGGPIGG